MQHGWRILLCINETKQYDFVIERDGEYRSVNVKQATRRNNRPRGYIIGAAGGVKRERGPDLYLVWLPRERRFLELPGDFLKGRSSRIIPKAMYFHFVEEMK